LVSNIDRFDEAQKDEADGVYNALGIFENILEIKPEMCIEATKQGLLSWLLKRIKVKGYDNNKLYSSEILSILVQNEDENRKKLGELEGIDILLQQLAFYKKNNPTSSEELEYMENLFNCLCSCLMLLPNRQKFLKGEGLQLMRLMLREQKCSRNSALKILAYAMNGFEGKSNCIMFVDILGLGVIFPLFMKPPKGNRKAGETRSDNEENIISIITSLLQNCTGTHKERIIQKFIENDHEKVDRLVEIYFKYLEKVHVLDAKLAKEQVSNNKLFTYN
jgi:beta-catenin-like protein 1